MTAGMREIDEKLALRRLEVAGLVRDAWWSAQRAAQELTIARHRVVTARELGHEWSAGCISVRRQDRTICLHAMKPLPPKQNSRRPKLR